jgi:hypothetical protein
MPNHSLGLGERDNGIALSPPLDDGLKTRRQATRRRCARQALVANLRVAARRCAHHMPVQTRQTRTSFTKTIRAARWSVRSCRAIGGNFADRSDNEQNREDPMVKRTTHRSSKGTKLYAVRDKNGRFKDIQTYKRAHGADIKRKAKNEK